MSEGIAKARMLSFLLGVGVALVSATSYSVGVLLQSLEAREAPSSGSLRLSLLLWLISRRRWVIGTLCVIAGWGLQAGALALAPLTVVQPTLAAGLFVLLVVGMRLASPTSALAAVRSRRWPRSS